MTPADLSIQPLLGAQRPASWTARRFTVLGMDLAWQGADEALTAAAAQVLASRATAVSSGLSLSILALRTPGTSMPTHRGLGAFAAEADGRAYHEAGGLLAILTPSGSCTLADLESGRISAFVNPEADLAAEAEALFGAPVWRFAARQGLVACHAATVIAPSGKGLLLRAAGGGGKSTLALAAWRQGLGLLAEEVTWIDLRTTPASPTLRGRPDQIHVAPDVLTAWDLAPVSDLADRADAQPQGPVDTLTGKVRLALPEGDSRLVGSAMAGPVVFLARGEAAEAGCWRHISTAEAHERWQATAIAGEASQRADGLSAALQALLGRGAYVLGGDTPPRLAARLLEMDHDWGTR